MSKLTGNHNWSIADDQSDTGKFGVRLVCQDALRHPYSTHFMTVHRNLLEQYL